MLPLVVGLATLGKETEEAVEAAKACGEVRNDLGLCNYLLFLFVVLFRLLPPANLTNTGTVDSVRLVVTAS